jgi:hypothetical protein
MKNKTKEVFEKIIYLCENNSDPEGTLNEIRTKAKNLRLRKNEEILAKCFNISVGKPIPQFPRPKEKWRLAVLKRDKNTCFKCVKSF